MSDQNSGVATSPDDLAERAIVPPGSHYYQEAARVGADSYRGVIYCRFCGHVAFYANSNNNQKAQEIGKEQCQRNPAINN